MEKNQTAVIEFYFVGLTDHFPDKMILFLIFLFVYLVTLGGNLGMVALIWTDSRLHTPMYFFLSHLSLVDASCSSSDAPKMLSDIFLERKVISFMGCAVQMWFIGQFEVTECFLLAAMACDRYIAICNPLLYPVIMSQQVCVQLVAAPYAMGILNAIIQETFTFCLPFCGPNVVNHFFCDILPVLSLACTDTQSNRLVLFIMAGAIVLFSGMIITISYVFILTAILKIRTANGRQKAFSTCSSHLTTICIMYGTLFYVYVLPESGSSLDINKVISLFYTVVIPMLNPLIYSVRNKEVKSAFWSKFERKMQ
ncbi:olfactory receptor 5G3-like [Pipistrellus kuhlii]|uniref:olfactory receptor 5G3-like n=1 Tax=Pipistrellus kuhlii TaxID=59472 RepID=UPI00174F011E|nr:olfactory receptor 5G3-like [Pipistrellus kuhlii]